jgi:hypothetical protein
MVATTTPTKRGYSCKYCTDYQGRPKPIDPETIEMAERQPSGDYKCYECCLESIQRKIVTITPDSRRAKEILAEGRQRVERHNANAKRWNQLNKTLGGTTDIIKPTSNRFFKYRLNGR